MSAAFTSVHTLATHDTYSATEPHDVENGLSPWCGPQNPSARTQRGRIAPTPSQELDVLVTLCSASGQRVYLS